MRAALDQHALARRAGERRDDRDRRRDHQRARAGDDQQDERAVEPVVPVLMKRQRRHHGDGGRQHEHRRRVDAREPLDQRLRRRPLRLRALDQVDDPRERGVAPQPRHADVERAAAVDRPGEHRVARRLLGRQRFAGDRRLIDRALAGDDLAVERDLLAGANDDHRADRDRVDVDAALAGGVAHAGRRPAPGPSARGSRCGRGRGCALRAPARGRTGTPPSPLRPSRRAPRRRWPRRSSAR